MKNLILAVAGTVVLSTACHRPDTSAQADPREHVGWSRNATIYEVNVRQFTPEGTFSALERELPRLQRMGVDILWLMPIHPIGEKNRKGSLGSYYAVKDYLDVNPEFGNRGDLVRLVKRAHELGMKVIVDWVANHTSWDNKLIDKHPDWYERDSAGNIIPPVPDWTDVASLDYGKQELWEYITDALIYWIKEADIDGYRCDVAGMMPAGFWKQAIPKLKELKPVFMLAEDESPVMHDSCYFDATYSWEFYNMMNRIARKERTADKLDSLLAAETRTYPADAYRMRFTTNHDKNSWDGTEYELLGAGARAGAVFTFTFPGIPLVYNGQEAAMNKRLRFFDKDTIPWGDYTLESFYTTLMQLKKKNDLIASGDSGGRFIKVGTTNDKAVYAFLRKKDSRRLLVILNLSDSDQAVGLRGSDFPGKYKEAFTGQEREFKSGESVSLTPWQYLVFESK